MHEHTRTDYPCRKAALMQFTKTTAAICADCGIRLNSVVPGLMDTSLVRRVAVVARRRFAAGASSRPGSGSARCAPPPAAPRAERGRARCSFFRLEPETCMNDTSFRRVAAAVTLGAALWAAAGAAAHAQTPTEKQAPTETAALPAVQKSGAVEYLSGGIGKDESTAFEAESRAWPLALQFAVTGGQRAQFASDVQVTVRDAAGRTVLQTASNGPFLLLRVAPGRYDVEATLEGVAKRRQVSVRKGASTKMMLAWPAAVGDAKS